MKHRSSAEAQSSRRSITRRGLLICAGLGVMGLIESRFVRPSVAFANGTPPSKIVNGDFSYPGLSTCLQLNTPKREGFYDTYFSPDTGEFFFTGNAGPNVESQWVHIPGFNASQFGWSSTQTATSGDIYDVREHTVQINYTLGGNPFAEIAIHNYGRYIYQDVATEGNRVYYWQLDHCSYSSAYDDSMNVMIGPPGAEVAQKARRTSTNGHGDQVGDVGTIICTHNSNTVEHDLDNQWEHYEGHYFCPEGQSLTRFTFLNVDSLSELSGNNIDNIVFAIAYPVYYDANGGNGDGLPSPKDNDYAGYRYEGVTFDVTSVRPTRDNCVFLGWSTTRYDPVTTADELSRVSFVQNTVKQPGSDLTLYAVWAQNIDVTVKKTWVDGELVRPDAVTVTLTGSNGFSQSVSLGASNGWTHTFSGLASITADRKAVTYQASEEAVESFKGSVAGNQASGFVVTNTYVIPILSDIPVTKTWTGPFMDPYMPDAVTVTLNGSDGTHRQASLSASNGWKATFSGVPERKSTGEVITYSLEEESMYGFETHITGDVRSGFAIENRCTIGRGITDKDAQYESWL